MGKTIDRKTRFWAKVDKSGDCWIWTANCTSGGYGQFQYSYKQPRQAHRVAWELELGPVPIGLDVLHHCDNPPCCRPDHLFLGTDADNVADRTRKGRTAKGSQNAGAKLTEQQVLEIRESTATARIVALKYGICLNHVYVIRNRGKWAWLEQR